MSEQSKGLERKENRNMPEERGSTAHSGSSNSDHNNASAVPGGTTDLDHNAARTTHTRPGSGSGLRSKSSVTGSDLDGQVADQ